MTATEIKVWEFESSGDLQIKHSRVEMAWWDVYSDLLHYASAEGAVHNAFHVGNSQNSINPE